MSADRSNLTVLRRGEEGYEAARNDAIFNAKRPARYPDAIALACDD